MAEKRQINSTKRFDSQPSLTAHLLLMVFVLCGSLVNGLPQFFSRLKTVCRDTGARIQALAEKVAETISGIRSSNA